MKPAKPAKPVKQANEPVFLSDLLASKHWNDASAFLDIETLGQKGGVPIHQISALFIGAKGPSYYEAVPAPFEIEKTISNTHHDELLRNTYDQKRKLTLYNDWKQAFDAKGRRTEKFFSYLTGYDFDNPTRPYNFMGIEGVLKRDMGVTPITALSNIFKRMVEEDKKILWIANANFEAGHFNAQLALQTYEIDRLIKDEVEALNSSKEFESIENEEGRIIKVEKEASTKKLDMLKQLKNNIEEKQKLYEMMAFSGRMDTQGRTSHNVGDFLYVNHPEVLRARAKAAITNDWEPVLKSIEELDVKALKGIAVLDPFDVIKGVTSRGARVLDNMGLSLDLKGVTRGISLELLGHAFYGEQEAHFGLEDNALTARVLKTMFQTSDALSSIGEGATLGTLNPKQLEAIDILKRMAHVKKVAAEQYAQGAIDRILKDEYLAKVEGRQFSHATMGDYRTEWTIKEISNPEGLNPRRIQVPVNMSDWHINRSPEEALESVAKIPGNESLPLKKMYEKRKASLERITRDKYEEALKARLEKITEISGEQSLRVRESVKEINFNNLPPLDKAKPKMPLVDVTRGKPPEPLKETPTAAPPPAVKKPSVVDMVSSSDTKSIKEAATSMPVKAGLAILTASFIYKAGQSLYDLENEAPLPDLDYDTFGLKETPLDNEDIPAGMPEGGLNAELRHETTDFGSPYRIEENQQDLPSFKTLAIRYVNEFQRSMGETPVFFEGMKVDQRIVDFQMFSLNTPMKRQAIEAMMNKETVKSLGETYFMGANETTKVEAGSLASQGISFQRDLRSYEVKKKRLLEIEDADTVIMHGGPNGQAASFRLSGIDAPEISHSGEAIESIRFEQNQPYGNAARERLQEIIDQAESVSIVFDPKQDTYGRALAVVMADGRNVNQQLVKEGWVKALPFGEVKNELIDRQAVKQAEDRAYSSHMGIYQSEFWRTEKQLSSERYRMTNNMLTRLDKLGGSNTLAAAFTIMDRRGEGEVVPNQAFQSAKRKLSAMGGKKKWVNAQPWRPNYYNNNYTIMPESPRYATPNYGISFKLELGQQKSTYLNTPTLIDSTVYSNSIYSYRKPQITRKFKTVQQDFHKMGQSVMTARTQNANAMMGA